MSTLFLHTSEEAEMALRVEIMVSAPGIRVFIRPEKYPTYQADPIGYIAREYRTTPQHVRRYIGTAGVIQCLYIRSNGKQCRNQHGGPPGQIELEEWLELDASGWYCNRHAE